MNIPSLDDFNKLTPQQQADLMLEQSDETLLFMFEHDYISQGSYEFVLDERGTLDPKRKAEIEAKHRKAAAEMGLFATNF